VCTARTSTCRGSWAVADFGREQMKVTTTRVRYRLGTPTNWAQLDRMLGAALNERRGPYNRDLSDHEIMVNVEDDEIVIWWETEIPDAG
jgi:hypothetical protein